MSSTMTATIVHDVVAAAAKPAAHSMSESATARDLVTAVPAPPPVPVLVSKRTHGPRPYILTYPGKNAASY